MSFKTSSGVISILFFLLIFLLPFISVAQGNGGGGDPDVPIDGGLSVLLAAGVSYGARCIVASKNQQPPSKQE